jgi:predicted nucleic acid-binding protein
MLLVDTSAWIEHLVGSPLGRVVARSLPAESEWLVPTIVQLELTKWLHREVGEDAADSVIALTRTCVVAPLDTETSLAAAELSTRHRLAMADAIIYATAQLHGANVLTCDRHFEGLDGVRYLRKPTR